MILLIKRYIIFLIEKIKINNKTNKIKICYNNKKYKRSNNIIQTNLNLNFSNKNYNSHKLIMIKIN